MERQRLNILNVPVDAVPAGDFEKVILDLLQKDGPKQIIFLSLWDLLKARGKSDFALSVKSADLVLPVSKSILMGARFLNLPAPERYNPFEAVISILCVLESHNRTLYLLGGKKAVLMEAERNVRATFPNMQIVGRFTGYYPKAIEEDVITAIRKATPSVVLLSEGVPDKKTWFYRRRDRFSASAFVYYPEAIGVFSKTAKRISNRTFDKGREIWVEILHNPFKVFLILPYLKYLILLLFYRGRNRPG
ncbi:MAG: WecB/TagA/CpsF family glycosyltransferase [Spirochaetaceae bacterium]|jgi:N-acetylglucosaminyldiphosphoundecaprenol N-acetyl-beta-D-mannosaminyltransferase|nr:WecB/TagA/CpsF family glycosyltransferase [Spirochaetaceae bacterium]